jgi:hypothetical protein
LTQNLGDELNGVEEWLQGVRARLKARGNRRPETKARVVFALWPEIRAALEGGQSLRTVRQWLADEGLAISYGCLSSYVSRIRRRQSVPEIAVEPKPENRQAPQPQPSHDASAQVEDHLGDPLRNVKDRGRKRPGFDYPPGVDEDALI